MQVDKLYNTQAVEAASVSPKEERKHFAVGKDSLALSDNARAHSELDSVVNMVIDEATKSTPADRLLKYKGEIANGGYRVSAEQIAAAMLGHRPDGMSGA